MHFTKNIARYENNPCIAIRGRYRQVGTTNPQLYGVSGKRCWRYDVQMLDGSKFTAKAATKRGCIVAVKRLIRKAI